MTTCHVTSGQPSKNLMQVPAGRLFSPFFNVYLYQPIMVFSWKLKQVGLFSVTYTISFTHLYLSGVCVICGYKNGHQNDTCSKRLDRAVKYVLVCSMFNIIRGLNTASIRKRNFTLIVDKIFIRVSKSCEENGYGGERNIAYEHTSHLSDVNT